VIFFSHSITAKPLGFAHGYCCRAAGILLASFFAFADLSIRARESGDNASVSTGSAIRRVGDVRRMFPFSFSAPLLGSICRRAGIYASPRRKGGLRTASMRYSSYTTARCVQFARETQLVRLEVLALRLERSAMAGRRWMRCVNAIDDLAARQVTIRMPAIQLSDIATSLY